MTQHTPPSRSRSLARIAAAVLVAAVTATASAQDAGDVDGTVRAIYDAELAFAIPGSLVDVAVSPGDRVEAGAVLARLDDRLVRAEFELAQLTATSDASLRLARERLELARLTDQESARGPAAVVRSEDQKSQVALRIAEAEVLRQQALIEQARREAAVAAARQAQHVLKAPVAGVVERVLASAGQHAEAGEPMVRLLTPERLLVEANVPSDRASDLRQGTAVVLYPKSGDARRDREPIRGTIAYVAGTLDPQTDSRFIRVELQGQPNLLPGSFVSIDLDPPGSPAPREAAPTPR